MAHTEFDAKKNVLTVVSGDKNSNGKRGSTKIDEYLSEAELKGNQAEELFRQFLDKFSIRHLRFSQNINDKSAAMQEAKRPDFLITVPHVGALLIDVKCRKKKGFDGFPQEYFQIDRKDMERLFALQHEMLLPVWVAFLDESQLFKIGDKKETKCKFFIASLTELYRFHTNLGLTQNECADILSVRIPDELLSTFDGELNIKFGTGKASNKTIKKFADGYRAILSKASVRKNFTAIK
ncbi:MAG: hypothetical protein JST48_08145 [Bacteroidetes bacterium]|nr:hypothetical protein [Bacteroidota bacterium]